MKSQQGLESKWSETQLPSLVDEIIRNYETFGRMDHLEGKDLPSKKVVIEVLEDLLTIFFPGYLGKTGITKSNIKYFLGSTLTSVYTRLIEEVEKSLKYICRKIRECPHDICHQRAQLVVKELLERIPELREIVSGDVVAAYDGDPAGRVLDPDLHRDPGEPGDDNPQGSAGRRRPGRAELYPPCSSVRSSRSLYPCSDRFTRIAGASPLPGHAPLRRRNSLFLPVKEREY
jgi:hypothetical protein